MHCIHKIPHEVDDADGVIINKNELLVRISLQEFMRSVAVGYTILSHDKVTQQNHVIKARLMMIRCCSISAYKCLQCYFVLILQRN